MLMVQAKQKVPYIINSIFAFADRNGKVVFVMNKLVGLLRHEIKFS